MFKSLKKGLKKIVPGQSKSPQQPLQPRLASRGAPVNGGKPQKRAASGLPDSYLDIDSMFK